MSEFTTFQNSGLIDLRCITTIGVSVKEGDNPIGFFGTGLKYAIAIILRNGGKISIWRGTQELKFTVQDSEIRGQQFGIVCMNDVEIGFTTHLGRNWEIWQAFRELFCNAKDEGGSTTVGRLEPKEGCTTVIVEHEEFADCVRDLPKYILSKPPVAGGDSVEFHDNPSKSMFYRSVRAGEHGRIFKFPPNFICEMTLTEDRTLKSEWDCMMHLGLQITQFKDKAFLERWLTTGKDFAEYYVDLVWPMKPSEEFIEVAFRLVGDLSRPINDTLKKALINHSVLPEYKEVELMGSEKEQVEEAIALCKKLGFGVDEFPIMFFESLGENILGRADMVQRTVFISRRAIDMGDAMLAGTLIEEWAHVKHGFTDTSRAMQNWLFDNLVRFGKAYLFERKQRESGS